MNQKKTAAFKMDKRHNKTKLIPVGTHHHRKGYQAWQFQVQVSC
jgi:hypothetical protein